MKTNNFPLRETVFGIEDSVVSTLGVVVGMAAGTDSRYVVILSTLVLIVVESISMAAGTYLSDKSEMEVAHIPYRKIFVRSMSGAVCMILSYVIGGFLAILPFFFLEPLQAIIPSAVISISILFTIGYIKGQLAGINKWRSGLEMSLISISAAALGYLIGKYASIILR